MKWCGVSHADVDEVVNPSKQQEKTTTSKASALITGMLRSGAKRKADIDLALKENGIDPEKLEWSRTRNDVKPSLGRCRVRVPGGNGFFHQTRTV